MFTMFSHVCLLRSCFFYVLFHTLFLVPGLFVCVGGNVALLLVVLIALFFYV